MPISFNLTDKEVTIDPVASLFKASLAMTEQGLLIKNRAVGTTVDIGPGKTGVVQSVDSTHMHVRDVEGKRHAVAFTQRKLAQLCEPTGTETATSTKRARRTSPRSATK